MRFLSELLRGVEDARLVHGSAETPVAGIAFDSRTVRPGDLFVAVPGFSVDARHFVPAAVAAGAGSVVAEAPLHHPIDVPFVLVSSAREALADLAAEFYGRPSTRLPVVGVTGTDGKTSTTHLISAILEARGLSTGWLTTVNTKVGNLFRPNAADNTTPEAPFVQATLAEMLDASVDVAILETSSHALALDRVRGTQYRVGVFTNLSDEHLNFHGTFEAYRDAKKLLFQRLPANGLAVVNLDDPSSTSMAEATGAQVLTFSLMSTADLQAIDISQDGDGMAFTLREQRKGRALEPVRVRTQLLGRFNVANWLAAYGAARYFGAESDDLVRAAECQEPVPGRMNLVRAGQPFLVAVDFAHTPRALETALATLRDVVSGRLLLVFGLAGGRDPASRRAMGRLAVERASFVVITMDDPGDESPNAIADEIAAGAVAVGGREGEHFHIELDRRSAIRRVLSMAHEGDAVLLAGKGHEQRMVVAGQKLPWNDAAVAIEELSGYTSTFLSGRGE